MSSQYSKTQGCPDNEYFMPNLMPETLASYRSETYSLKFFSLVKFIFTLYFYFKFIFPSVLQFVLNSHQVYCHTLSEERPANNLNAIKMLGQ